MWGARWLHLLWIDLDLLARRLAGLLLPGPSQELRILEPLRLLVLLLGSEHHQVGRRAPVRAILEEPPEDDGASEVAALKVLSEEGRVVDSLIVVRPAAAAVHKGAAWACMGRGEMWAEHT